MHYGREKIITDVTLKLALIDQLTQLKVFKLLTPQLTFDLCPKLYLLIKVSWVLWEKISPRILATFNKNGPYYIKGGGGVQGQISWKHDFEITCDPKGPPSGSTFWWGFEALEA